MAEPYATPTDRYPFVTHDPCCPFCRVQGRHRENCCRPHRWAYSNWLGGMQHMEEGGRRRRRRHGRPVMSAAP
jgi:hypothetical protein